MSLSNRWYLRSAILTSVAVLAACSSGGLDAPDGSNPVENPVVASGRASEKPGGSQGSEPLEVRLAKLPHVVAVSEVVDEPSAAKKRVPPGYRMFNILIEQPADHTGAAGERRGETFRQRLNLLHIDDAAPVVLATSGYHLSSGMHELGWLYRANVLNVEHRFFDASTPASKDWSLATIAQSAADFHEIAVSFKSLYRGAWLNTGGSKGGMTAVYHRRFFPNDVAATVAYVAPNMTSTRDPRFAPFIEAMGGGSLDGCRRALRDVQNALLAKRFEAEALMTGRYDRLGKDVAFEHGVAEAWFAFFQYQDNRDPSDPTSGCSSVPPADAPVEKLYAFVNATGSLDGNVDDESLDAYEAFYTQAAMELGYYAPDVQPLSGFLHAATLGVESYVPAGLRVAFRPESMSDIAAWVKREARSMLFIYGEYDPYTAAAFELGNAPDVVKLVVPKQPHWARLLTMNSAQREQAMTLIDGWLGTKGERPPATETRATALETVGVTTEARAVRLRFDALERRRHPSRPFFRVNASGRTDALFAPLRGASLRATTLSPALGEM